MSQANSSSPLSNLSNLPSFSGTFSTDEEVCHLFTSDYGNQVHRMPFGVLRPKTFEDVVSVVQFARQHHLKIAPRGQGHSTRGQSQVSGGIVVDMSTLNKIHALHEDRVEVEAGALWRILLQATLEQGLTPPVLPGHLNLSIGGVLAVGGIGVTSYRYGAIVDNVLGLQVVTGEGKLETCSATQQTELFNTVLAGLGQCAIIVKATLRLAPAKTNSRVFQLFYPDLTSFIADQKTLIEDGRFEAVRGTIIPTPQGVWGYMLQVASNYTPPTSIPDNTQLLSGLNFIKGKEEIRELTYFDYSSRLAPFEAEQRRLGLWYRAHPWLDMFIPASHGEDFVREALKGIVPAEVGAHPILLFGFHSKYHHTPLFPSLKEETFFSLGIPREVSPSPDLLTQASVDIYKLFERGREIGGKLYTIGSVKLSYEDWKRHFGVQWGTFAHAKEHFDPDNVLTPGQEIFPQ